MYQMNFSYSKQTLLRPQKEKYLSTFFIALFVAAALFVPFRWSGVYTPIPIGSGTPFSHRAGAD